jgi:hypothetical protein
MLPEHLQMLMSDIYYHSPVKMRTRDALTILGKVNNTASVWQELAQHWAQYLSRPVPLHIAHDGDCVILSGHERAPVFRTIVPKFARPNDKDAAA